MENINKDILAQGAGASGKKEEKPVVHPDPIYASTTAVVSTSNVSMRIPGSSTTASLPATGTETNDSSVLLNSILQAISAGNQQVNARLDAIEAGQSRLNQEVQALHANAATAPFAPYAEEMRTLGITPEEVETLLPYADELEKVAQLLLKRMEETDAILDTYLVERREAQIIPAVKE